MKKSEKSGFTLIETIVALSILGIVVIYLLPAIYINHSKRNDDSNNIKNAYYAQAIIENYKSKHFTGISTELNIPDNLEYIVNVSEVERFKIIEVEIKDGENVLKTKLALPMETGIYTH